MNSKLYVSNLPFNVDDVELGEIFAGLGTILSAKVIVDRQSGRSKGFGFVEFESTDSASEAIEKLNGTEQLGRRILVAYAKPQEDRAPRRM